eukprot:gene25540-11184_t
MLFTTPNSQSMRVNETVEFAPLLFSLSQEQASVTPRSSTPVHRTGESSMSGQRRSMTPGSAHTEATPPFLPPPIARLHEDMPIEEPGPRSNRMGASPPRMQQPGMPHISSAPAISQLSNQFTSYDDVWVTVFGFTQQDVPLILREFSTCGDILQWGTFGQPSANYLHLQLQNKYAAQRALLKNGEQLSPTLIVGVKPLDARQRLAIESYMHAGEHSSGPSIMRPAELQERPYRVEGSAAQQSMPQANRSVMGKLYEFVLGM